MSNNVQISYSSANKFKTCPSKYHLSKKYISKAIPSALIFGKAIEEGITALLKGQSLTEALAIFECNWITENHGKTNATLNRIYDNDLVEYYASDYDRNLFSETDYNLFNKWVEELYGTPNNWMELFENLIQEQKERDLVGVDRKFYNRVMWQSCYIRGTVMTTAFNNQVLPRIEKVVQLNNEPIIQKKVTLKNEEGDEIVGYTDYVLKLKDVDSPIIFDLKTAAYKYTMHALDTSDQLKTYVAALHDDLGTLAAGYIVLLKKIEVQKLCDKCGAPKEGLAKNCKKCEGGKYTVCKLKGDVQIIYKEFTPEELDDVLMDYESIVTAVKHNVNFKNAANCTQYNRQCEFYDICWKRKKAEELAHLTLKPIKEE